MVAKNKSKTNPFYVLLLIAGGTFAVTACAYGVMTVRALKVPISASNPDPIPTGVAAQEILAPLETPQARQFGVLVDSYGPTVMIVQLVLLAIGTFGAIAFDDYFEGGDQTLPAELSHQQPSTNRSEAAAAVSASSESTQNADPPDG